MTTAACTAAIGVGAALGFVPGYVSVALQDSLDLSKAQVGLLVSLYFGSTGLASVGGGRLAARFGARTVVVADMVLVAACAAVGAVTERYWVLLVSAVVAGAGYAWANAGTNDALARTVPPRHRTLALSIKTAGVPTMAATTAALGAPAAARWSWTVVWLAVAVVAVVVAVAVALTLTPLPAKLSSRPITPEPAESTAVERSVDLRSFHWFSLASFLFVGGSQPIFSWVVPYLQDRLGTSAGLAGGLASAAAGFGVIAMIGNGRLADRIGPDRRIGRLLTLVTAATAGMTAILVGPEVGPTLGGGDRGLVVVAAGMILGTAVQLATIGTMHAALVDRAGMAVAEATGVTMTGYYLGALLSPVGFGWLVDVTGRYWPSWLAMVVLTASSLPVWRRAGRIPVVRSTFVASPPASR